MNEKFFKLVITILIFAFLCQQEAWPSRGDVCCLRTPSFDERKAQDELATKLRDILEDGVSYKKIKGLSREMVDALKLHYLDRLNTGEIAQKTEVARPTVLSRHFRGIVALASHFFTPKDRIREILRGFIYGDWLSSYEEWLCNSGDAPLALALDLTIHNNDTSRRMRKLLRTINIPVPANFHGKLKLRKHRKYGFLLEMVTESGEVRHRYVVGYPMPDGSGHKLEPPPAGSWLAPLAEYYDHPNCQLFLLLFGYGPVDLLKALKTRGTRKGEVKPGEFAVMVSLVPTLLTQKFRLAQDMHLSTYYRPNETIPDVSITGDLARGIRRVTFYEPGKGNAKLGEPAAEFMVERFEDGSVVSQTAWLGSYNDWSILEGAHQVGRGRQKTSADLKRWARGMQNGVPKRLCPPILGLLPARKDGPYGGQFVVIGGSVIHLPEDYVDPYIRPLPIVLPNNAGVLLGLWYPEKDVTKVPPLVIISYDLAEDVWEEVSVQKKAIARHWPLRAGDGQWEKATPLRIKWFNFALQEIRFLVGSASLCGLLPRRRPVPAEAQI